MNEKNSKKRKSLQLPLQGGKYADIHLKSESILPPISPKNLPHSQKKYQRFLNIRISLQKIVLQLLQPLTLIQSFLHRIGTIDIHLGYQENNQRNNFSAIQSLKLSLMEIQRFLTNLR